MIWILKFCYLGSLKKCKNFLFLVGSKKAKLFKNIGTLQLFSTNHKATIHSQHHGLGKKSQIYPGDAVAAPKKILISLD